MQEDDQDYQTLVLRLEEMLENLASGLAVDESEFSYLARRVYNFTVIHAAVPLQLTQAKALNILASAPGHPVLHDLKYMAKGASQMYARLTSPVTNLSRDSADAPLGVEVGHTNTVVQFPQPLREEADVEVETEPKSSGIGFQRPSDEW